MDLQRGFIPGGQWAQPHGLDVQPIETAFNRVATLIHTLRRDIKMVAIQYVFPLSLRDTELIPEVLDLATQRTISPFFKNADNILSNPLLQGFLDNLVVTRAITSVVLVGTTITSCIRVSALELKRRHPNLEIFVDLYHCGGLGTRANPLCTQCLGQYINGTFNPTVNQCLHPLTRSSLSPNTRACKDMKKEGIKVKKQYNWNPLRSR